MLVLACTTTILLSCTKESMIEENPSVTDLALHLSVVTRASTDPSAQGSDDTFQSLALYIYDTDAAPILEDVVLLPVLGSGSLGTWSNTFSVSSGNKTIYVIANYAATPLKRSNGTAYTLSQTSTQAELEDLIAVNASGFSSNTLLMIGKGNVTLTETDNNKSLTIPIQRLQARMDIYVTKSSNLASNNVVLKSITLKNQVLNSEIKYVYNQNTAQMLPVPLYNNQTVINTSTVQNYIPGTPLVPSNAQSIFYSYQNLVVSTLPVPISAPSLEIKALINNVEHTYTSYLKDINQSIAPYSLLQNTVYEIQAVLDVKSQLILNLTVLPWDESSINYGRPITSADLKFGPWGTNWGGTNGKTMYTNVGGIEDAQFSFELKAPAGANWTATLTNGLDFGFTSVTAGTSVPAVIRGTARPGIPYLIAVRASKQWVGQMHNTEFYITVEGVEVPINTAVAGVRPYAGTDTRIIITQVASYN